jgi:putative resolvase
MPSHRTKGNQRLYDPAQLMPSRFVNEEVQLRSTIAYARVSSHDQKEDLQRQIKMLEMYCAAQGWSFTVIKDLGSGMNYHKRGLKQLLDHLIEGKVGRLVFTHKDRLLRFGAELVFSLCAVKAVEVVIINHSDDSSFEEELAQDVLEIITVFSARLYGARSQKNKPLMNDLKKQLSYMSKENYALKLRINYASQEIEILDGQSRICNWLYNHLLENSFELKKVFKDTHDKPTAKTFYSRRGLRNLLPQIKQENPFLKVVHSSVLKNTALGLSDSIRRHQKSKKTTLKTGWTKYRSWKDHWFSLFYDEPDQGFL